MALKSLLRIARSLILVLPVIEVLHGHPMGNFSVNHYARFDFGAQQTKLTYVLDLAEIPTLELLQQLKVPAANGASLESTVGEQAREWLKQLHVSENGAAVPVRLERVNAHVMDGAGGLQVLRVEITAQIPSRTGTLQYEDGNYPERTGWKEIVIDAGKGAAISQSSQGSDDRSHALTVYPPNEIAAPPQDVRSSVRWSVLPSAVPTAAQPTPVVAAHVQRAPQPSPIPTVVVPAVSNSTPVVAPPKPFSQQQQQPMGTVVRGDYLSRMLRNREIPLRLALIGVLFAFCLGAMHAFSPGHGKTIVAAYLVGTRGTLKHALFLGGMVTFTHTISVFALGLGVLFFQQYIVPEQIIPVLGVASGLSIVIIGGLLLYQRTKTLAEGGSGQQHEHSHADGHDHSHDHDHAEVLEPVHSHAHASEPHTHAYGSSFVHDHSHSNLGAPNHASHQHEHGPTHMHVHSHGGKAHSHMPDGKISMGSLIALGVSGGLVPCPSALILLLSAIALGRTGLGLVLLIGFSAGLALVLMGIGGVVIYAKQLLPQGKGLRANPVFRYVPVFSAVVVIVLGLMMTGVSMGWITPRLAI